MRNIYEEVTNRPVYLKAITIKVLVWDLTIFLKTSSVYYHWYWLVATFWVICHLSLLWEYRLQSAETYMCPVLCYKLYKHYLSSLNYLSIYSKISFSSSNYSLSFPLLYYSHISSWEEESQISYLKTSVWNQGWMHEPTFEEDCIWRIIFKEGISI